MAIWQALKEARNRNERTDFSKGLNTGVPALDVDENQSVNEYGFDTDQHPALSTRKGRSTYGSGGASVTYLLTNFGNTHLVRAVGTKLQYDNAGTWTDITGTFTATDWDAANFDVSGPALILTNGTDNVKYWNGSALADLNAADAPKGKYIAADNRRVYIATADVVNYCAFQDATDWTTALNAGAVEYYTANGGDLTALHSFQGKIWAFKRDAFCLIFHTGDSRATHRLVEASNNIGCASYKTVVEVGDLLFWLGYDDVYMGAAGAARGIGQPRGGKSSIKSYLDDLNISQISKCNAFTDGIRYYLNLVTGANTEPDTRLVYDPRFDIWRVPGQDENYRFGVFFLNVPYASDDAGQTHQVNDGTDDAGTAISFQVETKDFDEGIPEAEKEYYELHLQVYAPTGTTLTVSASVDQGNTYTQVGDALTPSTSAQNVNVIIPLDTVPLGNWIRFKFAGSGVFRLYNMERYFRVQPVQI